MLKIVAFSTLGNRVTKHQYIFIEKRNKSWLTHLITHHIQDQWDIITRQFRRKTLIYKAVSNFSNQYTAAGTAYEHRILDHLGIKGRDRQIRIRRIGKYLVRLRVNLDGEDEIIHEVKTHKSEKFTVSKAYWQQAQVEMFATRKNLVIDAYRLLPADYDNFFNPIDKNRLSRHPVAYDGGWVEREYLPRLVYLSRCMKEGRFPCKEEYQTFRSTYEMRSKSSRLKLKVTSGDSTIS